MKILHMISGGDVGGAKTHVLSLLRGLRAQHEVLLICFMEGPFAEEARAMGIPVEIIETNNLAAARKKVVEIVRTRHFSLMHCHGARANVIGVLVKRQVKLPLITTVHSDPWLDYMGRPISNWTIGVANRKALRKMDYMVGVSHVTCQLLIRRGFDPQRIFPIYNGVDFSPRKIALDREAYFDSIGLQQEKGSVVFGIAARISPVKDLPTLVRAFAQVVQEVPSARLVIAGDGEDRKKLETMVKELCPAGSVCFAGWVSDMDSFYNALDVNLLTSLSETFPYAITEGARMRCATVASAVGGVPKIVIHKETGFLFTPGDVKALAGYMLELAKNQPLRERLGQAIYEKTRREFSAEATVRAQEEIYKTVLRRWQRPASRKDGVVVCGAYGRGNAGDEAILASILQQLQSFDPDLPICVLSKNPRETALQTGVRCRYTFSVPKVCRELRKARLFISGGGSLIQDVTSTRSLLYYLWTLRTARQSGCQVMMYGCGIGPVSKGKNRKIAGKVIDKNVDLITLRDPESMEELRRLGVCQPKMQITADPALLQTVPDKKVREYMENAGLSLEGNYCMFVLRPWHTVRRRMAAFTAAAEYVYRVYGMTPVFFMLEPGKDREITEQIAQSLHCPHAILPVVREGDMVCGVIGQMKLVISMRLHALIFASGQGVPVVGVSYDPKVSGFLDYLGQENYVIANEVTESVLCDLIDSALSCEAAEGEIMERLRRLARQNGELAWQLFCGETAE